MKKYILPLASLVLIAIAFTACSNNASKETATVKTTGTVYTCKMHPEVTSDKPGKCPKCGMDLVKKEDVEKDSTMEGMKMDSMKMDGMKMDSDKH